MYIGVCVHMLPDHRLTVGTFFFSLESLRRARKIRNRNPSAFRAGLFWITHVGITFLFAFLGFYLFFLRFQTSQLSRVVVTLLILRTDINRAFIVYKLACYTAPFFSLQGETCSAINRLFFFFFLSHCL